MTSNIGTEYIETVHLGFESEESKAKKEQNKKIKDKINDELKKHFRPEFLNRIDEIVVFQRLTQEDMNSIVELQLKNLQRLLDEKKTKLIVSDEVKRFLAKEGYDEVYGARPLKRAIQRYLVNPISQKIISGKIKEGEKVEVDFDKKTSRITFNGEF